MLGCLLALLWPMSTLLSVCFTPHVLYTRMQLPPVEIHKADFKAKLFITCILCACVWVYGATGITCAVRFKQVLMTGPLHNQRSPAGSKWMFGSGVCYPGLVGAVGEEAEWKMAACMESVCTQLRLWQETVRVLLLPLHLPPPLIDLRFNFVNSSSSALAMESEQCTGSRLWYLEDLFTFCEVLHNIKKHAEYSASFSGAYSCYCFTPHMWSADKAPVPMSNVFHPRALVLYCRADRWVHSNHHQLQTA